ncbi:MAG: NAD-dependent deacylase [Bacteroidales bacterium]|nr:NAD-dependent deacylase [Bacteroidales bacterium]
MKKKVIVLTGAGISAESGIKTFRDSDGLWEEYRIEDVATYDAWLRNPALVLEFYNRRRTQLASVLPNRAHHALVMLEQKYDVRIITQNVDDLHERAGSSYILHLHGELTKVRSTANPELVTDIGYSEIGQGDKCSLGSQLRPHIVWFGEAVPLIQEASELTMQADILLVIGTSLAVYPAAGLVNYVPANCRIFLVDPGDLQVQWIKNLEFIREKAGTGVPALVDRLLSETDNN